MKLAVIIPAFNEEKNLEKLIDEIHSISIQDIQIQPIIVNDCSTDSTAIIAQNLDCILINMPVNVGIGGAVQTGMIYAYNSGFQYAIQVDGDGQHPPKEIYKLLEKMKISEANVVIGSRFIQSQGFQSSGLRRLGINYLKLIIKIFTGLTITDSTSGFRLYDRASLEKICEYYPDEYPEPEAIIYFHKMKLNIVETAVIMKSREAGKSSITLLNTIYYFWKVSLAIFFSYLKL
ncbi:MAG: hypothetical protein AUJ98_04750 [Bacteroidetes bacterium CG2_30_33_31]|nr:MAG: hypothetical protein AUJ98_04750 [Bacteroidetes bacterium CG2_30_33_31]